MTEIVYFSGISFSQQTAKKVKNITKMKDKNGC